MRLKTAVMALELSTSWPKSLVDTAESAHLVRKLVDVGQKWVLDR